MPARLRALLLLVVQTDTRAEVQPDGSWIAPCLHCQSRLAVSRTGEPLGTTTLEHIVPRSWFGRRAASATIASVPSAEAPENLALACARCNQQKGRSHDADGPASARARQVVAQLLARRAARLRRLPDA